MFDIILQIFWINFVVFIWFETNTFVEYVTLFNLSRYFAVDKYLTYKSQTNPKSSYLSYIRQNYNSFFIRLVTCVPCLLFWIVLFSCLIFKSLLFFPLIYLLSYIKYKLLKKYVY